MYRLKFSIVLLLIVVLAGCKPIVYDSEVTLPEIISDGMVLQRGEQLRIWGKGIPQEKIRVSLANVVASTNVGEDSLWLVDLPEIDAGGPYILEVNKEMFSDVYVGDVWLAGGQSNMEWVLDSDVIEAEKEFQSGGFDEIRFFKVPYTYSAIPQTDLKGGEWKVANSENMPDFSAVAWFFAKKNHLEEKVPVGIIESNWGGSPAEGWTDLKVLASLGKDYSVEADKILADPESYETENISNEERRELRDKLVLSPDSLTALQVASLGYDDKDWRNITLPNDNPLQHIAWLRKKFRISSTENAVLVLSPIDQMAFVYLNGKLLHHKVGGKPFPELEVPEEMLLFGQNVLTIRVVNTWNNQPSVGSKGEMYIQQGNTKVSLEGTWKYSNSIVEPQLPQVEFLAFQPGMMYNSMIHPLINYPIKGAIWYQGESNAGRHEEYRELFSAMIQNWRDKWAIGDFPFLFVQLANFMERKEVQPESNWAFLREAQDQTLALPNTGMAVIIDIGEEGDIHPKNKKDVGERLWLLAKNVAFGKEVLATGPKIDSVYQTENALIFQYSSVGKGLELKEGEKVKGFIIAGEDGSFEQVDGELFPPNQVRISLKPGMEPVFVRYAWADNPEVNLVNEIGLPAIPFRRTLKEN